MNHHLHITVKCPNCAKSLMCDEVLVNELPSIALEAKIADKIGKIYLSQIYGSYDKIFDGVDDIVGAIANFYCPTCHQPLPVIQLCDCKAPLVGLQLEVGGMIKICCRNGCKRHSLEFEDINDAFMLFMRKDDTGLG